jgi:hypothetical protein
MGPLLEIAYRDGVVLAVAEKFLLGGRFKGEMLHIIYYPQGAGYRACYNDCLGLSEDPFLKQEELPKQVRLAFSAATKQGIETLVKKGQLPRYVLG